MQALEKTYKNCRYFSNPLYMDIELLPSAHTEDTVVKIIVPKGIQGIYRHYEDPVNDSHVLLLGRNQRLTLILEPFYNELDHLKEYVIAVEPE